MNLGGDHGVGWNIFQDPEVGGLTFFHSSLANILIYVIKRFSENQLNLHI